MIYLRPDGVEMIEVAPHQAVNVRYALRFKLVTQEEIEAARRELEQREAA
jgi:hypothetical protein